MPDLAVKVRAAVAEADPARLRAAVAHLLDKLHAEHPMRDRAGNHVYSICADCCMDNDDNQSPECRDDHEHFGAITDRCWPCNTWFAVAINLGVQVPSWGD